MNKKTDPTKYLRYLYLPQLFSTKRTREILSVNPTLPTERSDAAVVETSVFSYTNNQLEENRNLSITELVPYKNKEGISWINIDGIKKADIELICQEFSIHALILEDILSVGQRPKTDEVEGVLYCLLNMLYFNEEKKTVETEQVSIVLGTNYVISFQEDASRDVFNPIRTRLHSSKSQLRQRTADYLLYSMVDLIVDNYFLVMEKLGEQIEQLEEEVARKSNKRTLARINQLRKELIVLKRNIAPVRDMVGAIIRSESELLEDRTTKYFKDVYDHITQAFDLSENYRDVMMSIQDLYLSNVNLKMNEAMKIMAVVTSLLAPATVIGGVFGMNFDIIPLAHHTQGFYIAIGLMIFSPLLMLSWFRRKGLL
jgi:magnesium transporter